MYENKFFTLSGKLNEKIKILSFEPSDPLRSYEKFSFHNIILPIECQLNMIHGLEIYSNGVPLHCIPFGLLLNLKFVKTTKTHHIIQIPENLINIPFSFHIYIMKYSEISVLLFCQSSDDYYPQVLKNRLNFEYQVVILCEKNNKINYKNFTKVIKNCYERNVCLNKFIFQPHVIKKKYIDIFGQTKIIESSSHSTPVYEYDIILFKNVNRVKINSFNLIDVFVETMDPMNQFNVSIDIKIYDNYINVKNIKNPIIIGSSSSNKAIESLSILKRFLSFLDQNIIDNVLSSYMDDIFLFSMPPLIKSMTMNNRKTFQNLNSNQEMDQDQDQDQNQDQDQDQNQYQDKEQDQDRDQDQDLEQDQDLDLDLDLNLHRNVFKSLSNQYEVYINFEYPSSGTIYCSQFNIINYNQDMMNKNYSH